jgi:hypothetical protein
VRKRVKVATGHSICLNGTLGKSGGRVSEENNAGDAGAQAPRASGAEAPMEGHKPKPIRDWRQLLTELAIVVVGVCLALAAQQAVDWLHWRNEVVEAREAIASEMATNTISAITRLRTQNCVERRLDALANILDQASRTGRLPPVGYIGFPPQRAYSSGAWESVVASQTASHFSREQLASLGRIYRIPEVATETARSEMEVWGSLSTMIGPGRRLDPASEVELRKSLGLARSYNRSLSNVAFLLLRGLKTNNLPYSRSELAAISAVRVQSLTEGKITTTDSNPIFLICQPLGTVPPGYGHSVFASVPTFWDEGKTLLPDLQSPKRE